MNLATLIADFLCEYGKWSADNDPRLSSEEKALYKLALEAEKHQVHRRYDWW